MPGVVFVHRLKVVCSEHENNKLKRGVNFDPLS
jgi:hypothetical protein